MVWVTLAVPSESTSATSQSRSMITSWVLPISCPCTSALVSVLLDHDVGELLALLELPSQGRVGGDGGRSHRGDDERESDRLAQEPGTHEMLLEAKKRLAD